jgi:hypothetical protein
MSTTLRALSVSSVEPVAVLGTATDLRVSDRTSSAISFTSLRPEIQLLISIARTNPDATTSEQIRALIAKDLDWSFLLRQAERHGVLPLLHWNLRSYQIPEVVKRDLKRVFTENAEFNLSRTREMLKLLDLFESKGIPALSFKGPLLAEFAYGNVALRQFSDLDILVQNRHFGRARESLLSRGYRFGVPLNWLQIHFPTFLGRKDNILVKQESRIIVELHRQLSGNHFRFPLDLKELLPRLQTTYIGGRRVRCLPPEEMLSYLCLHGSRHSWERLLWICDVAELIRSHSQMNWKAIIEQARKLGGQRTLALGLMLARDLLGTKIPADVWKDLNVEPTTELLALRLRESIFETALPGKGLSYWHKTHLGMRELPEGSGGPK